MKRENGEKRERDKGGEGRRGLEGKHAGSREAVMYQLSCMLRE